MKQGLHKTRTFFRARAEIPRLFRRFVLKRRRFALRRSSALKQLCRGFALAMALSMLLSAVGFAWSDALGEELRQTETGVYEQTRLSTNVFWSSAFNDVRTENYITYRPSGAVKPIVTYGSVLTEMASLTATTRGLEAQGYRVIAGINGDFYNTENGLPVGLILTDGQIRSSDAGLYAMGFLPDGSCIMGRPRLQTRANFGYKMDDGYGNMIDIERQIAGINKARVSDGGIFLFTYDFNRSHSTGNDEPGIDAVCTILSGSLKIGGSVQLRVDNIVPANGATRIAANQMVLSVNNKADEYSLKALRNLSIGNIINIGISLPDSNADKRWNDVVYGIGATYVLAENGRVNSSLPTGRNPRTAVGLRTDGTVIFYTIDGRRSGHSIGATLSQVGQRLIELGCSTVLGLDGGGSTTICVSMPGAAQARTINLPSEGTERAVSNKIFLVTENKPTGILSHFFLTADHPYVLAGSRVNLNVSAVDTNYYPLSYAGYSISTAAGTLSGSTLATPRQGGEITVTASGGGKSGNTTVHAVSMPGSVSILGAGGTALSSLNVAPGAAVQLAAAATYQNLSLHADADAFTWSAEGAAGTLSESGFFTAVRPGSGTITLTGGEKSVTIPYTVADVELKELDDFEEAPQGQGVYVTLTRAAGGEQVRYGRASGELRYDLSATDAVQWRYAAPVPMPSVPYDAVSLWVLDDGSGNQFSLLVRDPMGDEISVPAMALDAPQSSDAPYTPVTLDSPGWRQLIVPLGGTGYTILGFEISAPEGVLQGEDYFDNLFPQDSEEMTQLQGDFFENFFIDDTGADLNGGAETLANGNAETPVSVNVNSSAETPVSPDPDDMEEELVFIEDPEPDFTDSDSSADPSIRSAIYLDQMVATYDAITDQEPPVVTAALNAGSWSVSATVRDGRDGVLPAKAISVFYNGAPVSGYDYNASTGRVFFALPGPGESRQPSRVTISAKDASGNLARDSVDLEPYQNAHLFNDIDDCWAADYIDFLGARGIVDPNADGGYDPYGILTRVDFAVMLARSLGFDGRDYENVELPYGDLAEIPESARPALKVLYAENIMRGTEGADGVLYLHPNSGLTRAQASAMIGRSQFMGYANTGDLSFSDADVIPAYARSHIQTMVSRGILGGFSDGTFRPGANINRGQMAKILYFLA